MPEHSKAQFPLSLRPAQLLGCSAHHTPAAPSSSLSPGLLKGQPGSQNNPIQLQLPSPSCYPESEQAFPAELLLLQVLLHTKTTALDKAKSFRSPKTNTAVISLLFPSVSTVLLLCNLRNFQIFPLCPVADLCVLGCSEHEIPALGAVAGAWNVFLYTTVWFVVSLHVMTQFSANATVG